MTRHNNTKLRAVFLAALMVLWVFAGSVALVGSAAAQVNAENVEGADGAWESGTTKWSGQDLVFQDSGGDYQDYQIREFDQTAGTASNQVGTLVREFSTNDSNVRVIDTSGLEDNYVVTASDGTDRYVLETDSHGNENGATKIGSGNSAEGSQVEIAVQEFTKSEFASDQVDLGDSEALELQSNRDDYDVVISSDNLTQTALNEMVNDSSKEGSDSVRVPGLTADDSIDVWFNDSEVDEGNSYTFDVTPADTDASASASISVGSPQDEDADFDQASWSQQRGDVVTFSLTTTELSDSENLNVTISGENDAYVANLEVSPEDGEVVISMNTWAASRTNTVGEVFTAETGSIKTANSTTSRAAPNRILDAGTTDLIISEVDYSQPAEQDQEYDLATLNIEDRSTGEMTVHTAPHQEFSQFADGDVGVINSMSSQGKLTESSDIAIAPSERNTRRGDVVVHEVEVSGIYGALENQSVSGDGASLSSLIGSEEVYFTIDQSDPGNNADPKTNHFDNNEHVVVADAENDTLYVIGDSDDFDNVETGESYQANFTLGEGYQNQFLRSSNEVSTNETTGDDYSIVDREAEFDKSGDKVMVEAAADQAVTGTTTVAPGTEMRVRARATGEQAFLKTATATVAEDGTFEAVFSGEDSFEDASVGQNFTLSIRRQSFQDDAETDAQVGEAAQASVSLSDVSATEGEEVSSITVDSAFLPNGGFVTIHDGSLTDGATFDSVRGTSEYLSEGDNSDVEVSLDEPYTEDGEAIAMPHQDTNGNQQYDFVDTEGDEDGAYTDEDDGAVTDSASVTFDAEPTETATATDTETTDETATTDDSNEDEQAGFGAVVALIALLGAALLAARRNAF
jgi:surface glycoprotein (TIGR04207 family)/PGF-CTERM protein